MTLPRTRKIKRPTLNLTTNLRQHQVEQLQRYNHDAMKRHKFHQDRAVLMDTIKRKQKISTYEGERDRLVGAWSARRFGDPEFGAEQQARLEQLKILLGK